MEENNLQSCLQGMWRKIIFRFALKGVKGGNRCQVMSLSSLRVGTWMLEHPWILLRKRTHTIGFLSSSFIFSRVSTDINKCRRTASLGCRWRSSRYYYLEGSQVRHCLALPARSKSCTQGPMIEHSCNNEGEFLQLFHSSSVKPYTIHQSAWLPDA